MTPLELALVLAGAFVAAAVSAICGFGGGSLYMPVLVALLGTKQAVPLIAFGLLFSNATRAWIMRKDIVWPLAARYLCGAVPGAILGAFVFIHLSPDLITRGIGLFLIASVLAFRWHNHRPPLTRWWVFYIVGFVFGILSSITGIVAAAAMPFFLAVKMRKEAFVGTVAFGAFAMHLTTVTSFSQLHLLDSMLWQLGIGLGLLMIAGTWVGSKVLRLTPPRVFLWLVQGLLLVLGVIFLV